MARPSLSNDSFAAIAHPTRRAVLDLLRGGERSVGEMRSALRGRIAGASQPALSEHLATLLRAGVVEARKEGRERHYALRPEGMAEVVDWLAAYGEFWDDRLARFGKFLAKGKRK